MKQAQIVVKHCEMLQNGHEMGKMPQNRGYVFGNNKNGVKK